MRWTPRPWQPDMLEHIARHPRCGVFALPGTGKTSATLHALNGIDLLDEGPALILGPKRVAVGTDARDDHGVWANEATKWDSFKHEVVPICGSQTQRIQATQRKALFYATNYEQIPWLIKFWGNKWPYRTIIADELTYLKGMRLNQGGLRTQQLAKATWLPQVQRFVGLTGTPAPNGLKDLWGQLWYLDRGQRLGRTYEAFKERWFQRSHTGFGIDPLPHTQEEIQSRINDICITIDPRDYGVDVGVPIETDIEIELPDKARDLYRDMERKAFLEIAHDLGGTEIEAANAAARTIKLLQITSGFAYDDEKKAHDIHSAKIEALQSIVEEAGGMPIFVAVQFRHDLVMLRRAFPRLVGIDELDWSAWKAGRIPMCAVHPKSAGHGVDGLQDGTNIMVDYSSTWNLEWDDQIGERIGPMRQYQSGFDRPVYRYRLVVKNSVDELVAERRRSKRSVQSVLLEALKRRGEA
jgi:hypothetical protein